jgi:hypothetical protein
MGRIVSNGFSAWAGDALGRADLLYGVSFNPMIARAFTLFKKSLRMASYFADPGPREINWAVESLLLEHGHAASRRAGAPIDKDGKPLPWYTYSAISYLRSIDLRDKHVFEYGAGNSSFFWAQQAASVTSVEHHPGWAETVRKGKRPNQEILLVEDRDAYVAAIRARGRKYGVIVVDGERRHSCAREALAHLEDDGLIVLDNADWWPQTTALLREADLIEIDFTGFGPVLNNTWTTSLFLRRAVRIKPRGERLPEYGIGAVRQVLEEK